MPNGPAIKLPAPQNPGLGRVDFAKCFLPKRFRKEAGVSEDVGILGHLWAFTSRLAEDKGRALFHKEFVARRA